MRVCDILLKFGARRSRGVGVVTDILPSDGSKMLISRL